MENQHNILGPIWRTSAYVGIQEAIRGGETALSLFGMPELSKLPVLLGTYYEQNKPILLICGGEYAAQRMYGALSVSLGEECYLLPGRTLNLSRVMEVGEQKSLRIKALAALAGGERCFVVAGVDGARANLSPKAQFQKALIAVKQGQEMDLDGLIAALVSAGYRREEAIGASGDFSVRGGIVDVYTPEGAIRMDFFGDEVDSIRRMDALSQRSLEALDAFTIPPYLETPLDEKNRADLMLKLERESGKSETPRLKERLEELARENLDHVAEVLPLLYPNISAVDYLAEDGILMWDEPSYIRETAKDSDGDLVEMVEKLGEEGHPFLAGQLVGYGELLSAPQMAITFSTMTQRRASGKVYQLPIRSLQPFLGRMDLFSEEMKHRKKANYTTVVALGTQQRCESLYQTLLDRGVDCTYLETVNREIQPGEVVLTPYAIGAGFEYTEGKFALFSEGEVFRNTRSTRRTRRREVVAETLDLKVGDYAVHDIHGIGIYKGLTSIPVAGIQKDFMLIEYRGGDKLYIPADQLNRVQPYIGSDDAKPKINKMGGVEWERAKQKVRKGVKQLAFDLVAVYAQRQALKGYAFSEDTPWQREFEAAFPFDETEGQAEAIEEIKRDMESDRIMDRLLCGDVGYGKTEVAIRAAFKAAMDSKQTMVLVPTTILAQQHYATFTSRCAGYPVAIEVLSRFKNKAEQKEILTRFQTGEIDILIGTHRLLSKDVRPHDLGLLIVDEEHRFGVNHKDAIKDMKKTVDVLTLTATPIPRTLEMSLVNIRDMSIIHTPIEDRNPIHTYVTEYDDELLREAMVRELRREGQAYILYNDVRRMERLSEHVKELLPEARVGFAHGQMGEDMLEQAMMAFYEGEVDILICSTIIESGLDIPTANTIFILNADRLGLAQLYQLRGRVGRSSRTAYCYLTHDPQRMMTETAQKRLTAVSEFTELGSGFKIAMQDLQIRGAGNVLGPEQHGHMAQVGYDTYTQLLAEAIAEAKGEPVETHVEATVDIGIPAYIPDSYIESVEQKVAAYKRIAAIGKRADGVEAIHALTDRYGNPPRAVENLIEVAVLKSLLRENKIASCSIKKGEAVLRFAPEADVQGAQLIQAVQQFGEGASIRNTAPISIAIRDKGAEEGQMLYHTQEFLQGIGQVEEVETA
ncbi:transcription-repair coupling factor [Eubacteriales bacterium OttesenSCG-928-M02]|nr:transcription-repair coupling factor [Eubacteriales bacterium OttesenSCG-928-M02]